MKKIKLVCAFILILGIIASPCLAKDLKGKLGIGFNSQFSPQELDSLSGKYWINNELAVQALVGFNFSDESDELDVGGKLYFKLADEENLHVDAFAGLGIARIDPDEGSTETAKWISVGMGIEYFFSGLPNLGFSTEVGVTMMDFDDNTSFGTMGDSFVGAGIHYYFDFLSPSVKKPEEVEAVEKKAEIE